MSLPDGFLSELRARLSLTQVVGRKVIWDTRKSNQGKGDMWAPCPFHQEKTASFHVDDRKGYYYCFGCHAKGDAITFVRETENVSFMEAVEILAGEAGMTMPAPDPQAKAKSDRRSQLADVMDQAVRWFRTQLQTTAGSDARAYLSRRGLSEDTIARWELGFAPDLWQGLWDHLSGAGVAPEALLETGLAKPSQSGGRAYDTFRHRIMFPIRDPRGRCIAFGGRAMSPDDPAKYLNSPETILFDKGRTLYNHGPARTAAGQGQPLIVAEGYMDVIALSEAGFAASVAPLGTAITEHQLALLWRIAPEPVLALDGDAAGQRASARLIDLALPELAAGRSLRFLTLPNGADPDDYLKAQGPEALRNLLDTGLVPLVRALWNREFAASPTDTPEQKAGLDQRLRTALAKIANKDVQRYYAEALKRYRWEAFRPAPGPARRKWQMAEPRKPFDATRRSVVAGHERAGNLLGVPLEDLHAVRERLVAALVLCYPQIAATMSEIFEPLEVQDPDAAAALMHLLEDPIPTTRAAAEDRLGPDLTARLLGDAYVTLHPCVCKPVADDVIQQELRDNVARITADRAASLELSEANEDIMASDSETITWRLSQSAVAKHEAARGDVDDRAAFDTAPSGAQVDKAERDAFDQLLQSIRFSRLKR